MFPICFYANSPLQRAQTQEEQSHKILIKYEILSHMNRYPYHSRFQAYRHWAVFWNTFHENRLEEKVKDPITFQSAPTSRIPNIFQAYQALAPSDLTVILLGLHSHHQATGTGADMVTSLPLQPHNIYRKRLSLCRKKSENAKMIIISKTKHRLRASCLTLSR